MATQKALHQMSTDELAALTPEDFKRLADAYNDQSELNENARNREIDVEKAEQHEAMNRLIAEAEKMPREEFDKLPYINKDYDTPYVIKHGIPDPEDPANPYRLREAMHTPLEQLANKAWGKDATDALFDAIQKDNTKRASDPFEREARALSDTDLTHELHRLESNANHPEYDFTQKDKKRFEACERESERREKEQERLWQECGITDKTLEQLTPAERRHCEDTWARHENNPANYPTRNLDHHQDKVDFSLLLSHPDDEMGQILKGLVQPRPQPKFDPKHAREEVTPSRQALMQAAKVIGKTVAGAVRTVADEVKVQVDARRAGVTREEVRQVERDMRSEGYCATAASHNEPDNKRSQAIEYIIVGRSR